MKWLKNIFRKDNRPREKSLFWFIYRSVNEDQALKNYCYSEARKNCKILLFMPSKDLIRKYGLNPASINTISWSILEKYFNGELIEK